MANQLHSAPVLLEPDGRVHVITDAGGDFTRCPACGRLILHGQTCTCGTTTGGAR